MRFFDPSFVSSSQTPTTSWNGPVFSDLHQNCPNLDPYIPTCPCLIAENMAHEIPALLRPGWTTEIAWLHPVLFLVHCYCNLPPTITALQRCSPCMVLYKWGFVACLCSSSPSLLRKHDCQVRHSWPYLRMTGVEWRYLCLHGGTCILTWGP